MKGTIKVEKWHSRIFEKNSWFGDFYEEVSKLAQNQTLYSDIFLKIDSTNFFSFWPEVNTKYDLQFEWNLSYNSTKLKEMERNISGMEGF